MLAPHASLLAYDDHLTSLVPYQLAAKIELRISLDVPVDISRIDNVGRRPTDN